MFNSLQNKNVSRLAVAGTATSVSLTACGEGHRELSNQRRESSIQNRASSLQNEPNFRNDQMNVTSLLVRSNDDFPTFYRPKNEPKRTQKEPNFRPKLASFFPILALFFTKNCCKMAAKQRSDFYGEG